MEEMKIGAKLENLEEVQTYITARLENAGFSSRQIMQVELAVEEIFCNIANYAYKPETGEVCIRCGLEEEDKGCIVIEFIDQGTPYNPLEKQDPDISLGAEERQIGGLGIFLSKKLADSMEYRYEDGKNVLTFTKKKE